MIREVLGAPLWARTSHIVIFPSVCRWRPRTQESQQQAANTAEKPRNGCARNSDHCLTRLLAATATGATFYLAPQSAQLRGSDCFDHFSQMPIDVIQSCATATAVHTASAEQVARWTRPDIVAKGHPAVFSVARQIMSHPISTPSRWLKSGLRGLV